MNKSELIVLGLLSERSMYGYELNDEINTRFIRKWAKVSYASLYNAANRLVQKGLIIEKEEWNRKTPPKKIYTITEKGKKTLKKMVKEAFSSDDGYYLDFNLGMDRIHLLSKNEAIVCLDERLKKRELEMVFLEEAMKRDIEWHFGAVAIQEQYKDLMNAEIIWLKKIIIKVKEMKWK